MFTLPWSKIQGCMWRLENKINRFLKNDLFTGSRSLSVSILSQPVIARLSPGDASTLLCYKTRVVVEWLCRWRRNGRQSEAGLWTIKRGPWCRSASPRKRHFSSAGPPREGAWEPRVSFIGQRESHPKCAVRRPNTNLINYPRKILKNN